MTDITDLEWLARNEPEWRGGDKDAIYRPVGGDMAGYASELWVERPGFYSKPAWQSERQRLGLDAQEWDGEGLPPVGVRCLCDGMPGVIIAHGTEGKGDRQFPVAVIQYDSHGVDLGPASDFSPLKSQEQREREDLRDLIQSCIDYGYSAECIAACLRICGYRKQD